MFGISAFAEVPFSTLPGPSGDTYDVSITEATTGADACALTVGISTFISEETKVSAVFFVFGDLVAIVAESVEALDVVSSLVDFNISIVEASDGSDSVESVLGFAEDVVEAASINDTVNYELTRDVLVSESVTGFAKFSSTATLSVVIKEAVDIADEVFPNGSVFNVAVQEDVTAADTTDFTLVRIGQIEEASSAKDTFESSVVFNSVVAETAALNDIVTANLELNSNITESVIAADTFIARLLWELIDDFQPDSWNTINSAQKTTWETVNTNQTSPWIVIKTID